MAQQQRPDTTAAPGPGPVDQDPGDARAAGVTAPGRSRSRGGAPPAAGAPNTDRARTRARVHGREDGDTGSTTVAIGTAAGGPPADTARTPGAGRRPAEPAPEAGCTGGEALARYLQAQAASFLRGLSLRGENETEADALLCGSARRIAGVLHTYRPLTDEAWAEHLRAELGWMAALLGREPEYTGRLARLLEALRRLSAAGDAADSAAPPTLGAARAAALLERQLTLARTRAHSATLQAMGSGRFHAVADAIAVLASEVPLTPAAGHTATSVLPPLAGQAYTRLADAVDALPLHRAGHPYNAEAVEAALGAELTADLRDAPWHQVRVLLRLTRYAAEVPGAGDAGATHLSEAAQLLQRHHEAAESASAVAAAARTPRIAPATAYALGVLHADQRHEVEAARFAFSWLWQTGSAPHARSGLPDRQFSAAPGARSQ